MDATRFTVPRELLEPELRDQLAKWILNFTGKGSTVDDLLEQIDRVPIFPPIDHLRVDRDPRPTRGLFRKTWHWRVHAIRMG